MKKVLLFISIVLIVIACSKKPLKTEQTENTEFQVELLFIHDGCAVYRFKDAGRYIYYTDCRGKVEYSYNVSTGKSSHTEYVQNQTVK